MVRAEGIYEAAAAAMLLRIAAVVEACDWSHARRIVAGAAEAWKADACRFLLPPQRPLNPQSPAAALQKRTASTETTSTTAFTNGCGGNADGVQKGRRLQLPRAIQVRQYDILTRVSARVTMELCEHR